MHELTSLKLEGNKLKGLPLSLYKLVQLRTLSLKMNRLNMLPTQI